MIRIGAVRVKAPYVSAPNYLLYVTEQGEQSLVQFSAESYFYYPTRTPTDVRQIESVRYRRCG